MSITPMLKLSLLLHESDVEPVCEALQVLGVVHLETLENENEGLHLQSSDLFLAHCERFERIRHALASLSPAPARLQMDNLSVEEVVQIVEEKLVQLEGLNRELAQVNDLITRLQPWGDFDPQTLACIRAKTQITFAVILNNEWPHIVRENMTFAVSHENEDYKFVIFFGDPGQPVVPIELPEVRLSVVEARRQELKRKMEEISRYLSRFTQFAALLNSRLTSQIDRVALYQAVHGGFHRKPIVALQGYLPREKTLDTEIALEPFKVVLRFEEPDPQDRVPVLFNNNRFFSGFEVIVKAFSGVHYREKDITWMVGLLFILFGSLCLLDAGYGLLLMITGLLLNRKNKLGYGRAFAVSGLVATLIGLANGQIFGLVIGKDFYTDFQPLFPLAVDPFACFVFSLVVGAVSMGFAYSVAIWQRGWKTQATGNLVLVLALANYAVFSPGTVGKLANNISPEGLAHLASFGSVGALGLVLLALLLWILFPDPVFGPEAKLANIFWTLYSGATGLIQDILSHMRLFGIALSGSILALVINRTGSIFPLPVTVLFAILGHGLVYALALLSMFVHANRLIFLEAGSKCIDGGQHYYEPLRRGYPT